jgi:hypothetical protein
MYYLIISINNYSARRGTTLSEAEKRWASSASATIIESLLITRNSETRYDSQRSGEAVKQENNFDHAKTINLVGGFFF